MSATHGVPLTGDRKEELVGRLLEHVAGGECSRKEGPACWNVSWELCPAVDSVIHMQISVLKHICPLLSARQLEKVLEVYSIECEAGDNKKG